MSKENALGSNPARKLGSTLSSERTRVATSCLHRFMLLMLNIKTFSIHRQNASGTVISRSMWATFTRAHLS